MTCRKALKTATKESRSGKEGAGMARMYLGGWVGWMRDPSPAMRVIPSAAMSVTSNLQQIAARGLLMRSLRAAVFGRLPRRDGAVWSAHEPRCLGWLYGRAGRGACRLSSCGCLSSCICNLSDFSQPCRLLAVARC
jgi:hypothetical protein